MNFQDLVISLLGATGFPEITRCILAKNKCVVLMLHGISAQKIPEIPQEAQPYLDIEDLRKILSWLKKRFAFLTPHDFFAGMPGVLLTFDDGLANNYANALPVLEKACAPAVFFVSTQHVHDPRNWLHNTRRLAQIGWGSEIDVPKTAAKDFYDGMSEEQVKLCASHPLITIGSHTISHPLLTSCDAEQIQREVMESKEYLEKVTGTSVDLFAYPTGDYDQKIAQAVKAAGYRAAFAVLPRGIALAEYEIPRIGLYQSSPNYLSWKFSGLHQPYLSVSNRV